MPPEIIYDGFVEEDVLWKNSEMEETKRYRLGRTLQTPWFLFFPWIYDRRVLDEMRYCCPRCDELTHMIEHWEEHHRHWPEPFFFHHYMTRHQNNIRNRISASSIWGPIAYVTSDAKAFLQMPYWG
jgi:hypothetical protein